MYRYQEKWNGLIVIGDKMKIIRVFPRKTKATPDDADVRINCPPGLFDEADEIHISVTFSWDLPRAEWLEKQWSLVAPVRIGGPATGEKGGDFSVSCKYTFLRCQNMTF